MLSIVPSAGVDVGQQYLDLGFFPFAKPMRVTNTREGIQQDRLHSAPEGHDQSRAGSHRLVCA